MLEASPLLARELAKNVTDATVAGIYLDALAEECVSDAEAELEWFYTVHAFVRARIMAAAQELVYDRRGKGLLKDGLLLVIDSEAGELLFPVHLVPGDMLPHVSGRHRWATYSSQCRVSDSTPGVVWLLVNSDDPEALYAILTVGASRVIRLAIDAAFNVSYDPEAA